MRTNYEERREVYEDALFALLMEDMSPPKGESWEEFLKGLETDPAAQPPEGADEEMREFIAHSVARLRRERRARLFRRGLTRAVLSVMAVVLLLTTAFAVSEDFRVGTLNLLIEISDVSARLVLRGDTGAPADLPEGTDGSSQSEAVILPEGGVVLMDYWFPAVPEGFEIEYEGDNSRSAWVQNRNGDAVVYYRVLLAKGTAYHVDTEGAQSIEPVEINGLTGLLIQEDADVRLSLADGEQGYFISVICVNVPVETVRELAEQIVYCGT